MRLAEIVKNALFGSFQYRPVRLGRVAVDLTTGIFTTAVVHVMMALIIFGDPAIRTMLVAHQMGLGAHKSVHHGLEYGNAVTFHRSGSNRSATLNSDEHSLFFSAPAAFVRFSIMWAGIAAQIFFVQFNDTA